jgi:site-specific recombinase XerD
LGAFHLNEGEGPYKPPLPKTLSKEEILALLGKTDFFHRALFLVLHHADLRKNEAFSLRVNDVDIEKEFVRIKGKDDKERIVPMSSL